MVPMGLSSMRLLFFYLIMFSAPYVMSEELNEEEVLALVKQGQILSLKEIWGLHPFLVEQTLLDLELEYEGNGSYIYEIETLNKSNAVVEYEIDAATGQLLQEEFEE